MTSQVRSHMEYLIATYFTEKSSLIVWFKCDFIDMFR